MTPLVPYTVYSQLEALTQLTLGRTMNDCYFDYLMTFVQMHGLGGLES